MGCACVLATFVFSTASPLLALGQAEADKGGGSAGLWPEASAYYGLAAGKSATGADVAKGSAQEAIGWWTGPDAKTASQDGVPSPWSEGAGGCRFVLLKTLKLTKTSAFPNGAYTIGLPETEADVSLNGGVRLTVPTATVYRAKFDCNSSKLTTYDGDWDFVQPGTSVTFSASNVDTPARGAVLAGRYASSADVVVRLKSTFSKTAGTSAVHRLTGDFSRFRGTVCAVCPTLSATNDPYVAHQLLELASPTALGDPTAPRDDAFVLADNTWLRIAGTVDQSVPRGIRFDLAAGEKGYLPADAADDWTLAVPTTSTAGRLIKEGAGALTLAGPLSAPELVVTNGTLVVASSAALAVPKMTFYSDGARDRDHPLLTFADGGAELAASITFSLFGTNKDERCVIRAPAASTNRFSGSVRVGSLMAAGATNRVGGIVAEAGSLTVFGGKFNTESLPLCVSGPGSVCFGGRYESYSHFSVREGEVTLEQPGNISYGFKFLGGRVVACADNALRISSEKAGRTVLVDGELEIGTTSQRLWGLTGTGVVRGEVGSVAAPAGVVGGETVACSVRFAGAVSLAPAGGNWRFTSASTSCGALTVDNGWTCFSGGGGWAGTNVTVRGGGVLELANPQAFSDVYGRLAVEGTGRVTVPRGVAARMAFLAVDGTARTPGTYGSTAACARYPGVVEEPALSGEGVLVVTGGDPSVETPYSVTGELEIRGDRVFTSLSRPDFRRISVAEGTLTLDLAAGTVLRVTTLAVGAGGAVVLPADVTVDAATVLADGVPLASGTYRAGDVPWLTGEGTLTVLAAPVVRNRMAARVLTALRRAGDEGTWYASWLRPWSYTGFVVPEGVEYRPADPDSLDLESTSTAFKIAGAQPLLCFYDFSEIAGTWQGARYYAKRRAGLTALVKAVYRRWGAIVVFSWHPENPYVPTGYYDPDHGSAAYRYRGSSAGYPSEHRYVMREILENTGGPCGLGRSSSAAGEDGAVAAAANPRAWFDARLDEIASFVDGLRDEKGRPIPIISRLYHECEDSWQWWGADYVSTNDYKRIFRYTAEALRWRLGAESGRVLFAYSPDRYCWPRDSKKRYLPDGEEQARAKYMSRYAGDDVTDIIGYDDYSIGGGASEAANETNLVATIRQIALVSKIAAEHGKAAGLFESMGEDERSVSYFPWLCRAMRSAGCRFGFANTWRLPLAGTECAETWKHGYLDRPEVRTVGHGPGLADGGCSVLVR